MSEEILDDAQTELDEPMTVDELLANAMQDLLLDNEPDDLASEFIDEFVLRDRPETPQILAMFDLPTESLVEMFRSIIEQSYQTQMEAVSERGHKYLESVKAAVKKQLTELAE